MFEQAPSSISTVVPLVGMARSRGMPDCGGIDPVGSAGSVMSSHVDDRADLDRASRFVAPGFVGIAGIFGECAGAPDFNVRADSRRPESRLSPPAGFHCTPAPGRPEWSRLRASCVVEGVRLPRRRARVRRSRLRTAGVVPRARRGGAVVIDTFADEAPAGVAHPLEPTRGIASLIRHGDVIQEDRWRGFPCWRTPPSWHRD